MTAAATADDRATTPFDVHLDNFEGPFDLLLRLISQHELDITEVALSRVTDDFVAHIAAAGDSWDLDQASGFLVVAATLLDLKVARLLPGAEAADEEDLALLEARDLLFARLLQYRAFKQVAALFAERLAAEGRRVPRSVSLEPRFAEVLPEVLIGLGVEQFAELAARALQPTAQPLVETTHLHAPQVSVRAQALLVAERLARGRAMSFRALCQDATDTLTRVGRFLAVLELFREGMLAFEQVSPLAELTLRWTGGESRVDVADEYDDPGREPAATDGMGHQ